MFQTFLKREIWNTLFFMILYTKNMFLQHARYGNTQHIISYSAFSNHICSLPSMNPHIVRMIIMENEYCMHYNKDFVAINM